AQSSLDNQHPCPECPDRSYVRMEVAHIEARGLLEQNERTVQVTLNFLEPSHRDAPSIAVLRKPDRLTEVHAARHVLAGDFQVVPLAVDLAHSHVHVGGATENGRTVFGDDPQGIPV